jgi:hypothetical protein
VKTIITVKIQSVKRFDRLAALLVIILYALKNNEYSHGYVEIYGTPLNLLPPVRGGQK